MNPWSTSEAREKKVEEEEKKKEADKEDTETIFGCAGFNRIWFI